jgi:transposase
MRKGYYGLGGLVNAHHQWKLHSGDGFVFVNRRRTMIKILIWDRTGFVIYSKRLDRGTIELPDNRGGALSTTTLMLMLEGIDLRSIRRRKRRKYQEKTPA